MEADRTAAATESRLAELERFVEQAAKDLQQAQVEIAVLYGIPRDHAQHHRWPSWTPQTNTIRWAEKLLGKDFGYAGCDKEAS